ncbi:hypothetical protein KPH14_010952 [Odynerus spinipes]|uniref:RNA transcription, translation and transport factor protein n=1 Tax=Odynerus spinipes TaxID=1348599 RepID=A0AAD9RWB8_9HYME|nr:hypothetical protein KPH14_010952 [Odynerus spinipes]
MFERKLKALRYLEWDKVNGNNTEHFRKVVVWLEDQKIRHYTIEKRNDLRNITSDKWPEVFQTYCKDVKCPITTNPLDQLEWLIGHAISLEYVDDKKKYQQITGKKKTKQESVAPSLKSVNPLDNLDFYSNEFESGVNAIAKLLKVPRHASHLVTLEACSKLVCNRLNAAAIANPDTVIVKGKPFPVMDIKCGLSLGDVVLDNAAKGLTLLHIQDLRNLQTKINEVIVSVQSVTANPKTDTKLGKVGK